MPKITSEPPYEPEPGSTLDNAKKVADEEEFLKKVGATKEEEEEKKLRKLDEDYLNEDHRDEEYQELAVQGKVLLRRLNAGEISPNYRWMVVRRGFEAETAEGFEDSYEKIIREATKDYKIDLKDYDTYLLRMSKQEEAEKALMKDIFPKFGDFLREETEKAQARPGPNNYIPFSEVRRKFMNGEYLEK